MKYKYKLVVLSSLCCVCAMAHSLKPQDPTTMTNYMRAADVPQSAATGTVYSTPWKTFQTFYTNLIAGQLKPVFECYTPAWQVKMRDGEPYPTDAQFTAMTAALIAEAGTNFHLMSFTYTNASPKQLITIEYTYDRLGATNRAERLYLTLVDTASGWKIDEDDDDDLNW